MEKAVRKIIDFSPNMCEKITEYGKKRGCRHFGETIRDIVRTVIENQPENVPPENNHNLNQIPK